MSDAEPTDEQGASDMDIDMPSQQPWCSQADYKEYITAAAKKPRGRPKKTIGSTAILIAQPKGKDMRKEDSRKTRVCVQYDDHPRLMCSVLCSLMEHQSLVDLAIRCGNNTMHAHKCILAATSPYFREQLEKNPGTEQVIINGLDFPIMKSVIEFIYCGETIIAEDHLKAVVAAAKLFQIRGLQALGSEAHVETDELINIPAPIFLNKKPKYSSAYVPFIPNNLQNAQAEKTPLPTDPNYRRLKRKYVRSTIEAEKACAREARASRLALEALKKELGSTNQMHNFEIEDTCTETTVENFIPHTDEENFIGDLEGMPLQVVSYCDLNTPILTSSGQIINMSKGLPNNMIPFEITGGEKTVDKIKDVFCQEMQTNVEIMYKTPEGEFVKVTDEVLRNITGDTLQFQVIDEHGREGEVQLLEDKIKMKPEEEAEKNKRKFEETIREFINTSYSDDERQGMGSNADDLDKFLMNLQAGHEPKCDKPIDIPHISKFEKLMADFNESSDKMESPEHRLTMADADDHSDILNEINSMQYYDKSVYEDVADHVESVFQVDYKHDRYLGHHECGSDNKLHDGVLLKSPKLESFMEGINIEASPKYSPRKTRSSRSLLHSDSSDDLLEMNQSAIRKKYGY